MGTHFLESGMIGVFIEVSITYIFKVVSCFLIHAHPTKKSPLSFGCGLCVMIA
jgi:hypothetical protein